MNCIGSIYLFFHSPGLFRFPLSEKESAVFAFLRVVGFYSCLPLKRTALLHVFLPGGGGGGVKNREYGLSNLPSDCVRRLEELQVPVSMDLSVFQVLSHMLKVINWLEGLRADYSMLSRVTCSLFINSVAWTSGDGVFEKDSRREVGGNS